MLSVEALHHQYGSAPVLSGIDLTLEPGEILCLLGASGSGKSTLLRIIAGLEPLQRGQISFDGAVLAQPGREPAAEARQFGLVFQDHVLFPHMSVLENVCFGLPHLGDVERTQVALEQLRVVNLEAFADRFPHTLSGGQQQRVALARALAPQPRLMLLDEPFASVDSTLRRQLREDARRALRAASVPAVVVTHDAQEAMELADRIAVVHAGKIVQVGTPQDVWRQPANVFIAELFNDTQSVSGQIHDGQLTTAFGSCHVDATGLSGQCRAVIRPQGVRLNAAAADQESGEPTVVVEDIRCLGHSWRMTLLSGAERLRLASSLAPELSVGAAVTVDFDSSQVLVYRS